MSYPKFKEWSEEDKNSLIKKLKILENEFNQMGYDVILHGGTLLGAIREKDLILTDNDVDIIIFHKTTKKEEVKTQILEIDNKFNSQNRLCGDLHFLGQNHYFVDKNHFDGWHGWLNEDNKFYVFYHIIGELTKEDIFPLKSIYLRGEEFKIPNKPNKMLELLYGSTWKIPSESKPKISGKQIYTFFNGHRYLPAEKQLSQKDILLDLKSLLDYNGINFWLQTGTLLGAVRDGNFIKWDEKDIDIGLDIKDRWKVKEILDKSDFKYKWQWDKEIAIYKGDKVHPHIDLFFHTFDNEYAYCYSYKPNRISTIWNEEWRLKIPRKILEPLKTITFLDRPFKIPNKAEQYLAYLYGEDWQTPNPEWKFQNFKSIDKDYQTITAIVPTFHRNESLQKLAESFYNLYPEITLLVGNQNSEEIPFTFPNMQVIQLEEDCGLSCARNKLISNVKTEYTLLLEDDFVMCKKTDIYKLLEIFSYKKNIGIVGGRLLSNNQIKSYEKFLFIMDKILVSIDWQKMINDKIVDIHHINRIDFGIADIIYNFFLAKTDILKKLKWDDKHKVHSEHIDFFINLKLNSDIKVAFVPEVLIQHEHPKNTEIYQQYRERMYYDLIYTKYGIEKGYTLGENSIVNYKENKIERI